MKLLSFLDTAASDAFAREIGAEFLHNYPPAAAASQARDVEAKLRHAIEVMGNRAAKYDQQAPLGWYRKSRFVKAIRDELTGKGHDEALADRVVYAVVLRMGRRQT